MEAGRLVAEGGYGGAEGVAGTAVPGDVGGRGKHACRAVVADAQDRMSLLQYNTTRRRWVNLERLAASSAVIACGAEGSGDRLALVVKPAVVKQELSDVLFGHA